MNKVSSRILNVMKELSKQEKKETAKIKSEYSAVRKQYRTLLKLISKYKNSRSLTQEDIDKIQSVTCYHNIAYCCGLSKSCIMRDTVRFLLNVDDDLFRNKESWTKNILEGKGILEPLPSSKGVG